MREIDPCLFSAFTYHKLLRTCIQHWLHFLSCWNIIFENLGFDPNFFNDQTMLSLFLLSKFGVALLSDWLLEEGRKVEWLLEEEVPLPPPLEPALFRVRTALSSVQLVFKSGHIGKMRFDSIHQNSSIQLFFAGTIFRDKQKTKKDS